MKHFVISDLHLNMGKVDGQCHPLEDFDSDAEFDALLDMILNAGGELIINGDWIDFLQLEPFVPLGDYRSAGGVPLAWTASTALWKLETCLQTQQHHFSALASFLKSGGRLVVMQGNHDADWFFPAAFAGQEPPLQKQLRQALGDPSAEVLRFEATSIRVGNVHIEHGHQQCEWANVFQRHPDIFHADRANMLLGERRLELLWGSRFVVEFFNDLEKTHPFADNLKPTIRTLVLGIRNGWVNGKLAAEAIRFFWGSGISWRDVGELLDAPKQPIALIQGIEDDDVKAAFFARLQQDPQFQQALFSELAALSGEEQSELHQNERSAPGEGEVAPWQEPVTLNVFRRPRELRNAERLLEQEGVRAVVFGHTHQEVDGNAAGMPVPRYFNTGTWTPRFDLRVPENRKLLSAAEFPLEILRDRQYFELRLMYAEITVQDDDCAIELKEMPHTRS